MDEVTLTPVDEPMLVALLAVAVADATADEVTPPLTDSPEWTEEQQQWFLAYHRDRQGQLDGPAGEATWAVLQDGHPVGSIRLKRTGSPDTVETGIWLGRSARGRGIGTTAILTVAQRARAAGAQELVADTAATNLAAQTAMRRAGFTLTPGADGRVRGVCELR